MAFAHWNSDFNSYFYFYYSFDSMSKGNFFDLNENFKVQVKCCTDCNLLRFKNISYTLNCFNIACV
jgi:hypothetical protein